MSPYDQMASEYDRVAHGWTMRDYVAWYAGNGFVYATPDYFVMGRPVRRAAGVAEICSPKQFKREESDCWYVHAFAGDLRAVWGILPYPLPWVAFDRLVGNVKRKELRFYLTELLQMHCIK